MEMRCLRLGFTPLVFCAVLVGCGGSNSGTGSAGGAGVGSFKSGFLEGRAAISSPPIIVSSQDVTATALVGNFVALKAANQVNDWRNSRIVFVRRVNGLNQVFVMDPDGTDSTQITNEAGHTSDPTLSKDGTKIAYVVNGPSQSDLFMINVDGSGRVALTNTAADREGSPTFNGNGTRVAYDRAPAGGGPSDVYWLDVNTKAVTQLTNDGTSSDPSWDVGRDLIWYLSGNWKRRSPTGTLDGTGVGTTGPLVAGPVGDSWVHVYDNKLFALGPSTYLTVMSPPPNAVGGLSPDMKYVLVGDASGTNGMQLRRVDVFTGSVTPITNNLISHLDAEWGPAPKSSTLIGSSNALALTASGFIYGQQGDTLSSALAFKATTQSTVVVATEQDETQGPNIIYTVDADDLTNVSYANGPMLRPIRVVGPGADVGNADGVIISMSSSTGKISNVLAFVGTRSGKPTIERQGGVTVIRGELTNVVSNGESLGSATEAVIQLDGSLSIR